MTSSKSTILTVSVLAPAGGLEGGDYYNRALRLERNEVTGLRGCGEPERTQVTHTISFLEIGHRAWIRPEDLRRMLVAVQAVLNDEIERKGA